MNNKSYDVVLDDGAIIPARAHDTDAGYDLFSPRTGVTVLVIFCPLTNSS